MLTGFFVADECGVPITMELSDEIVFNSNMNDPVPVFPTTNDAELAWQNWCELTGKDRKGQLLQLTNYGIQKLKDLSYTCSV